MLIRTRLRIIILLPLLSVMAALTVQYRIERESEAIYAQGAQATALFRTTQMLIRLTYEYGVTDGGERPVRQWRNQMAEAKRILHAMDSSQSRPSDIQAIKEMQRSLDNAARLFFDLTAHDPDRSGDGPAALRERVATNLFNRVILELQTVLPEADRIHEEVVRSLKRFSCYGIVLNTAILLSLALSLVGFTYWLTRGMADSLGRLQAGIQAVARGELSYRIDLATADELGDLARGFDVMTAQLAEVTVSHDELTREIAERREAEEALAESERRLREAQQMAHVGHWRLDLPSNSLSWSDEIFRIFEIDKEHFAATYQAFLDVIHPDDREAVNQAYTDSLAKKIPYNIEHRLLLKDGRVKQVQERCQTSFAPDGTPLVSIGTVQDVTERKEAELALQRLNEELERRVGERTAEIERSGLELRETQRALMNIVEDLNEQTAALEEANVRLQEVDRLKSMFIATMSHELRTPLNSVIGFSSIVMNEWLGPLNDEQKAKLAIVLRTGKHLLALINDLIDVSKIEAGKLESIVEAFDLHDLITEAVGMTEADAAAKGLVVSVEAVHQPMRTDRRRLYQCVVNLLGNAVKFTRQGGIAVTVARPGEQDRIGETIAIAIKDTGIGIKEEDLPKLFTSFLRLPLPEDMQVKGTGLGLYLVKKIVTEILGGTVEASSVYGQGSEFLLTVPVRLGETGPVARGVDNRKEERL